MKVLGFGAILWDEIKGVKKIGGAVFNLLAHMIKLGARAYIISTLGKDKLGTRALQSVKSLGIKTDFIKMVDNKTCVAKVKLDDKGVPKYFIENPTSWDFIDISKDEIEQINRIGFDYFCFGTIEQRNPVNAKSLKKIISNVYFKNVFYDVNLRSDFYNKAVLEYSLNKCNILKVNKEEIIEIKNIFGLRTYDLADLAKIISKRFKISIVCITAGKEGAYVYSNNVFIYCPGYKTRVIDTVGSGDAFGAAFLTKLSQGSSLKESCDFACKLSAHIASLSGAIPDYDPNSLE